MLMIGPLLPTAAMAWLVEYGLATANIPQHWNDWLENAARYDRQSEHHYFSGQRSVDHIDLSGILLHLPTSQIRSSDAKIQHYSIEDFEP